MDDTRQLKKNLATLRKNLQTLSGLLPPIENISGFSASTSFILPLVLANFFASANVSEPNRLLITEHLKKMPGSSFFDHSPPADLATEPIFPETASLIAHLFTIKTRHILGDIYETLINTTAKKSAGQYYTPDFIVRYILSKTIQDLDIIKNPFARVLDPACGCGHFLLPAYDLLKAKFTANLSLLRKTYRNLDYEITDTSGQTTVLKGNAYWQAENIHYHILRHSLFGADTDQNAVLLTIAALLAKGGAPFPAQTNIICCDSLVRPADAACPHFAFWSQKFDYIIGNPPYVSFGLKRAGTLQKKTAAALRQNYPNSAEYKISYYALFLERAVELAACNGKIGFITPDSFLTGRYFSKIRSFILANCLINELVLLDKPVFAASVGFPVISIFTKTHSPQPEHRLTARKWEHTSYTYRQSYFSEQPYCRFRLFFSQTDAAIILKMDNSPHILKDFVKIKTGIRSLTKQKDVINQQPPPPTSRPGILSSAEVKPFFLDYQGNLLDVDPAKLNPGGWDKKTIENPKILIRQTGSSLIAALDEEKLYHLNNVHSISPLSEAVPLTYLLSLLNSKLLNYYYKTVSLENRRSMAQTDIETLEKLPVIFNSQYTIALTHLAQKLKRCAQLSAKNTSPLRQRLLLNAARCLKARLNEIVYRIYRLTPAEINHVENTEKEI
ncbi:MAG: N-6 DNA methylase [Sporomusaceae bacterium]|jgi:type I restriction-modification system DNA methylase subunit|nr:N-6 DNA methylase [Sporomusaceae bacterium]